jgi:hypothetical protein
MGTLSRLAIAVVALVVVLALVGGLAGCVDDGWYYASGELPVVAPPAGTSPGCAIDVAPPATLDAVGPRAPRAPPSARSSTLESAVRDPNAPANERAPAAFRPCERNATD